ncbi:fumarylacetoacetate hydrolase family protein [Leucothrix mucor]|uniref:fumarylacetoacetate hydrolase family protein n=1 Tax=Leucothrix mucor TaxID=45248 RepID=UPI00047E1E1B|nr:fumarylacetoacetate hydrolase family protein [Leucothrix mucor]
MRIVSFLQDGKQRIGCPKGDQIINLSIADPELPTDLLSLLEAGPSAMERAKQAAANAGSDTLVASADITYLPLITRSPKVICIGRNYAAHAKEGGVEPPTYPEIFYRGNTSLIGHNQPILRPECSDKLDYEAELVAIIGKRARHVSLENALDYVAGYSIFNDATLRDYQRKSSQWTIGKNFDDTGAFGPEFVTADELPAGAHGLNIQTRLNGQVMQDANTRDFIFPIDDLVVKLSECMTLEPGDVIVTGTPAGVGYARNPPVFMKAGDLCEVEIEGIGVLSNPVQDEAR